MASPVSVRLDRETRELIGRIARRKGVTVSRVIREAIEAFIERPEVTGSPYEAVVDLNGVVRGRNPKRSMETGHQFAELLKRRRSRA